MGAIVRKELADHFGAARFLLMSFLIIMGSLISARFAGEGIQSWLREGLGFMLEGRSFILLYSVSGTFMPVFLLIGYFGPLAAMLLGFDAINRERLQGTLAKILAQPVYRDELLAGKILAGLLTLALMTAALLLLIAGFGLAGAGLVPTLGEIPRLLIFWVLSVTYLGFWLTLAVLMSILCRSVSASALASAALWIFMTFFVPFLAGGLAQSLSPESDPLNPARQEVLAREDLKRKISLISPTAIYNESAAFLLDPARRTLNQSVQRFDKASTDRYTGRFTGPLEVSQSLMVAAPHLAAMLVLALLTFQIAYLVFMKQEIRSN